MSSQVNWQQYKGGMRGTIYLLHFDSPLGHARHYLGWTENLEQRLESHRMGQGARLMLHLKRAGIGFRLARTWEGTRNYERRLKNQGASTRHCPLCGVKPIKKGE